MKRNCSFLQMHNASVFLLGLLLSFPVWALDELKPADFSGAMIYSGSQGSLLVLEIPMEVYHGLRRHDLGDLRVFDASEQAVPHIIRERPNELFSPPPQDVPFFNWNGGRENNFPVNTDIEINTSGGVVRIKNQAGASDSSVFLVDLSALQYMPSTLKVKMDNQGRNFNAPVTINYSTDLSNWALYDKRQVLASFGDTLQDTLELPEAWKLYLLLKFDSDAPPPQFITAFFKQQESSSEYHELTITGRKSSDGKTVNYFTGGFYPAEEIDFFLTEADSIPVIIKNRFNENDEWNIARRGTIFRYNSTDGIEKNAPFIIASGGFNSQPPYWELEAAGGLPFSSVPDMVIRWKARELIFPARGSGPWTLAFGNIECPPLSSLEILTIVREAELEEALFTGEIRYEKTDLTIPGKRSYGHYILWAVLGTAVLLLSILAFKIAQSMKK